MKSANKALATLSVKQLVCLVVMCLGSTALAGCVSDEAARYYAEDRYAPRPVDEVVILSAAPSRKYEIVADFQARNATPRDMQKKAAKIGADAVIVTTLGGFRARNAEWADDSQYADWYTRIAATAIKYKD